LEEPFGFLQNREIYDMLSITQETLHSIKKKNIKVIILKLDFFKAYDRVDWTFLHLILIQLGMNLITINLIMGCIQTTSFVVLINGSPYIFFKALRGLRQACTLSPFPFLIIAEALRRISRKPR
jgi:hypothetical protein